MILRRPFLLLSVPLLLLLAFPLPLGAAKGKGGGKGTEAKGPHLALGTIRDLDAAARTFSMETNRYRVATNCSFLRSGGNRGSGLDEFKDGDAVTLSWVEDADERVVVILGEQGGKSPNRKKKD